MMERHVSKKLSSYLHGELSLADALRVAEHLRDCPRCQAAFEEVRRGAVFAAELPLLTPFEGIWQEILAKRVAESPKNRRWILPAAVATAVILLAIGVLWVIQGTREEYRIVRTGGALRDDVKLWKIGEWLVTNGKSRALVHIADIGEVRVEPNSRLRLLAADDTQQRLELKRGTLQAVINAPPRVFAVETPSSVAVDLGCVYTLEVDDSGVGRLRVLAGWVSFERGGVEAFVPRGAQCETRPERGPGTPVYEDASPELKAALTQLDFGAKNPPMRARALETTLAEARKRDALTLWHLLSRVSPAEREKVFDRISAFVPPPEGVTKAGVAKGDRAMLDRWWDALGLRRADWWRKWKGDWRGGGVLE